MRFDFGENWQRFLGVVNDDHIAGAEASMRAMLDDLNGCSFLDVGSGSGLSSLAAVRLGASRVHSFDFDRASVECTEELRRRYGDEANWTVEHGDILSEAYVRRLGTWDIVYVWGVLHHTGDMWRALDITARLVAPGGRLFVSLYNDQGTRSRIWLEVKRIYNRLPAALRVPYVLLVMAPSEILAFLDAARRGQPRDYFRQWSEYHKDRGMSRWHNLVDWVGGYPFEVSTPGAVFDFFKQRGFTLTHLISRNGLGCNEYVFRRD